MIFRVVLLLSLSVLNAHASNDCNSLLTNHLTASIQDLAKLRYDLDSKIAAGDSSVVVRGLENAFARKKAEILSFSENELTERQLESQIKQQVAELQTAELLNPDRALSPVHQIAVDEYVSKIYEVTAMKVGRKSPTAVMINDHQVLLVGGGHRDSVDGDLTSAEIYNLNGDDGVELTQKLNKRDNTSAFAMGDGTFVIVGGRRKIEFFDPKTNRIKDVGAKLETLGKRVLSYAPGKLLFYGMDGPFMLFDVQTQAIDSFSDVKGLWNSAISVFPNGQIVISGGAPNRRMSRSIYLIDPAKKTKKKIDAKISLRSSHDQVVLDSQTILVLGGKTSGDKRLTSIEKIDLVTGVQTHVGDLPDDYLSVRAALLEDGRVVILSSINVHKRERRTEVHVLNPVTHEDQFLGSLKSYRSNSELLVSGRNVYVFGGYDQFGKFLPQVDKIEIGK